MSDDETIERPSRRKKLSKEAAAVLGTEKTVRFLADISIDFMFAIEERRIELKFRSKRDFFVAAMRGMGVRVPAGTNVRK